MSAQAITDMFDDLDSTRVKLRLAAARRRLRSPIATSKEAAAAEDVRTEVSQPLPSEPDDNIPSGGFQ